MWTRRTIGIGSVAALVVLGVGCSSDDDPSAAVTTTAAPTTTEAATTTVPPATTPPTTAPAPLATFPTPTAAGQALFSAWTKGDRVGAGAVGLAPPAELDKLFAAPPLPAAKNRGCDDGDFDAASCFFGNDQGGVNVGLSPAAGGWSITSIDPFA